MNHLRILLLSDTRPSRAWRFAERVSIDMPNAQICGVLQHSWRRLPRIERLVATGFPVQGRSKVELWFRKVLAELVHRVVWFVHGCPPRMPARRTFTVNYLAERCSQLGRPLLITDHLAGESIAEFTRQQQPDLIIVLGEPPLDQDLPDIPSLGLIRVVVRRTADPTTAGLQKGIELEVQHSSKGSIGAPPLAFVSLPSQAHDGLLGLTLKSDLIADDLLIQAAKSLDKGNQTQVSKDVKAWIESNLAPYLDQFEPLQGQSATDLDTHSRRRHRSIAKMLVQSLLCSPWIIGRNWYRRLRGRYPVLILAHHLVSDRFHRMGMPTEDFWNRIQFLQTQYRIVSLYEADRLLRSGRVNAPTLVLTMDDGYCDNFVSLRAVAEETGTPIALFVATRQVELHREFDHDVADGTRGFFPLTWDQIRHWKHRGVDFGSHTRTHFDCGSRDPAKLEPEIAGSKTDLERCLQQPTSLFAFPFGQPENMSAEARQLAASTYSIFLSSFGGENLPDKDKGQYHLLRKKFYFDSWELELELQSVFDLVQSTKLRLRKSFNGWHPRPAPPTKTTPVAVE
jgi:peptidoglycan/xylan/chitin deacetylase (PgdA/CDA1 family)